MQEFMRWSIRGVLGLGAAALLLAGAAACSDGPRPEKQPEQIKKRGLSPPESGAQPGNRKFGGHPIRSKEAPDAGNTKLPSNK